MSGHSKWSQIKRQKGVADVKRGAIFTKLGREISIAAREGGPDPEGNFKLRLVVQKARDSNMPLENIERAIKKAAGGTEGATLVESNYEGYGPGGTAVLIQAVTDNKNRTTAEIRSVFSRHGGNLGEAGSVAWMFDHKGVVIVGADGVDVDELGLAAIDAGADDIKPADGTVEVYTPPSDMETVRKALELRGYKVASSELSFIPKTTIRLDEKAGVQSLRLLDKLEDLDDVQRVFSNADFPDEVLAAYQAQQAGAK